MNIFLSYGHDEYDKFALRLKADLEQSGFKVWMDVSGIRDTADWEKEIESGINWSDWFVIMMTQHSCRRPDGVCLDEVSYARFLGKQIAPIMIQDVKPPLCIARIQYIDMENFFTPGEIRFDEESYQAKFNTLCNVLRGVEQINMEGEYEVLRSRLIPLDNDVYYDHFRQNYYGREKLFRYYRDWVQGGSQLLWIVGNAGVGKTAFIAKLAENNDEIKAVHFCRYNDSDRADPKRAIMSIAYYLSTQNEEFKRILLGLHDLERLQEKSVERLFAYLLAEPLNKIRRPSGTTVIVIDALDEATTDERNELADILAARHSVLPKWVKLIITSRDEPILRRKLSRIRPITFTEPQFADNDSDIYGYLEMRLRDTPMQDRERVLKTLLHKSAGNFLYAKTITEDILSGVLSPKDYAQFPDGLTGVYASYFDRMIQGSSCDYRREIRPVLEILCAEYSPIPSDRIIDILDLDEYDFDDIKDTIAQMFPERSGIIEPVHKSIADWLVDRHKAGAYRVSLSKGHKKLAEHCLRMKQKRNLSEYVLKYTARHLIHADMYDEAIVLLNDRSFQDRRIRLLGLDTAFRHYLTEIASLFSAGIDVGEEIYKNSTFLHYFSAERKFLYNTGLYFKLRDSGFDSVLEDEDILWDLDAQVGIANYLYITERFDRAIAETDRLLEKKEQLQPDVVVELHNLLALCHRKYVAFDLSKLHFQTALDHETDTGDEYDKSISAVNLGKIAYHELDWPQAALWNRRALELLERAFRAADSEDLRIHIELFIAEYHRLIAECLIWNMDVAGAEHHLGEAAKIYRAVASRDRYYVRYIYTSALVRIFGGNTEEGLVLCASALEQATSKYDHSQIQFYRGIALLAQGDRNGAAECAADGLGCAQAIGAWLECEELTILRSIAREGNAVCHTERWHENSYIRLWSEHAERTIREVAG